VRIDRALVRLESDAVERVEQLGPGEDPTGARREGREELELGRRQLDGRAAHRGPHARQVEDHIAGLDRLGGLGRAVGPAEDGADTCDQLARAERLREVVVGTEFEAEQLVELVVARGQHDDRDGRVAAELAGDVEPVEPRQTEIEDDEIGPALADRRQRRGTVGRGEDRETRMLEVVAGEHGDLRFVVDDEDGLHVGPS
jgi:hypothetical protein